MRAELGHASEPGCWQAGPKRWGRGAWPGWSSFVRGKSGEWVGDSLGQGSECWAAWVWVGPRGKAFWAGQGKDEEAGLGC